MRKMILLQMLFAAAFLVQIPLQARTVYVTRHGQVGYPIKAIRETRLTELGVSQAENLAQYMVKNLKFKGTVYASPLYRTIETATYTGKLMKKKVVLEPGIQELALSKRPTPPGMSFAKIESYFPGLTVRGKTFTDKWRLCNESHAQRMIRVAKALERILAQDKGDIMLVGHGASVGALVTALNKRIKSPKIRPIRGTGWNCALFIFELDEKDNVIGGRFTTEFMKDSDVTNNFRCPKIERPNDRRYMTRAQQKEYYKQRAAKEKAAAKAKEPAKISSKGNAKERFIYVARHCQAGGNVKHRPVRGDNGITDLGIEQSRLLGKRLKALKFNGPIYASPYYRTVATACYAAEMCGSKVYPDPRVQQRVRSRKGNIRNGGATLDQLRKLFPQQIAPDAKLPHPWLYKIPEQDKKLHQERMGRSLDAILKENPSSDIMIVSHAGAVGALMREIGKRSGVTPRGTSWNCALYIYAVDAKGKLRFAGYDISFLPDDKITANLGRVTPKQKETSRKFQVGKAPEYKIK